MEFYRGQRVRLSQYAIDKGIDRTVLKLWRCGRRGGVITSADCTADCLNVLWDGRTSVESYFRLFLEPDDRPARCAKNGG